MAVCPVHDRTPSRRERMLPALIGAGSIAGVAAVAAVLRFRELGLRTIQEQEATASLIANQLARGGGYEQLPVTHGPFHYFATALVFRLFGAGDVAARATPALFGVLLALLPLLFARQIGRAGAIAAAVLLAVSPTMVYYSRFAGPDIELAFFSLATAMVIWRYLAQPERVWLYILAAMLGFMFVTTEMALAITAIFAAYLAYRTSIDFMAQAGEADPDEQVTHYDLLGVRPEATVREVRLAYKKALGRARGKADRDAIADAFRVLTNASRREAYDRRLAQRRLAAEQRAAEQGAGMATRALIMATGGIIALLWPFAGRVRRALRLKRLPVAASPLIVITMLALPFYGPLVEQLPFVGDRGFSGQTIVYVIGGTTKTPGGELPVMLITLGVLFAIAGTVGMAWRWHVWVICWAAFYGITMTMFTGFFTNKGGLWTGVWGTLDYWWRPEAQRADGPASYYAMLLPPYELLPIAATFAGAGALLLRGGRHNRIVALVAVAAIAGIAAAPSWLWPVAEQRTMLEMLVAGGAVLALRCNEMTKFLSFWTVAASLAFSTIGRKEPWLAVHLALPLSLLAGKLVGDAVAAFEAPRVSRAMASLPSMPPRRLAQATVLAAFAAAAVFAGRAGALASWGRGGPSQLGTDVSARAELIQPDRVGPDVRVVAAAVDRAAAASGKGRDLPVAVDTSYGFSLAWLWYLRDYRNLQIADIRRGYQVPAGAVAIFDARNRAKVRVDTASTALTFTASLSFPLGNGKLSPAGVASELASVRRWEKWSRYVVESPSATAPDTQQGVAYFPSELSAAALPGLPQSDVLSSSVEPQTAGPPAR